MRCPKCSTELPDSLSQCYKCGYKLKPSDLYLPKDEQPTQEITHIPAKHIGDTSQLPLIENEEKSSKFSAWIQRSKAKRANKTYEKLARSPEEQAMRKRRALVRIVVVLLSILIALLLGFFALSYLNKGRIALNQEYFDDSNLIAALRVCDEDANGYLSEQELTKVRTLDLSNKQISSLKGLEYFTNLEELKLSENGLSTIDLSSLPFIKHLELQSNALSSIDLSALTSLQYLDVSHNEITELDVSKNTQLSYLDCRNNKIQELNLLNNPLLSEAYYDPDVSISLELDQKSIKNPAILAALSKFDKNKNTVLEARELDAIKNLRLEDAPFDNLDILVRLKNLDVLEIEGSNSSSAIFPKLEGLTSLSIRHADALSSLNLSELTSLQSLSLKENPSLKSIDLKAQTKSLEELYIDPELAVEGGIYVRNTKDFPNKKLREIAFSESINKNGDDMLSDTERASLKSLDLSGANLSSTTGISAFYNLEDLNISNNEIANLKMPNLSQLKTLRAQNCQISSADLSKLPALTQLDISNNALTKLKLNSNESLKILNATNNKLELVTLPKNSELSMFGFNLFLDLGTRVEYGEKENKED